MDNVIKIPAPCQCWNDKNNYIYFSVSWKWFSMRNVITPCIVRSEYNDVFSLTSTTVMCLSPGVKACTLYSFLSPRPRRMLGSCDEHTGAWTNGWHLADDILKTHFVEWKYLDMIWKAKIIKIFIRTWLNINHIDLCKGLTPSAS